MCITCFRVDALLSVAFNRLAFKISVIFSIITRHTLTLVTQSTNSIFKKFISLVLSGHTWSPPALVLWPWTDKSDNSQDLDFPPIWYYILIHI